MTVDQTNYLERTKFTQYLSIIGEENPDAPEEIRYRFRRIEHNTFITDDLVENNTLYVTKEQFEESVKNFQILEAFMKQACAETTDRGKRLQYQNYIMERIKL